MWMAGLDYFFACTAFWNNAFQLKSAGPLMVCTTLGGSLQNDCRSENMGKQAEAQVYTHPAREANEQIIKGKEIKSDKQVFQVERKLKPDVVALQKRVLDFFQSSL